MKFSAFYRDLSTECFAPTESILAADFTRTKKSVCCHCEAAGKSVNMHGEIVKSAEAISSSSVCCHCEAAIKPVNMHGEIVKPASVAISCPNINRYWIVGKNIIKKTNMNALQLRQKIESQLDKLSAEKLAEVSDFLDSIRSVENTDPSSLRKLPPIKRGKTAKDLLKFAATWQGDDLETCLNFVRETRSKTQF